MSSRPSQRGPFTGSRPRNRFRAIESCVTSAEVLVDRLDPVADRIGRAADLGLLAAHVDLAARHRHRARQHLDQRRLPRPVVAEQPDDLLLAHGEVHVLERAHPPVVLGDPLHADQVGHASGPRVVPPLEPGVQRHHPEDDRPDEDVVGQPRHPDQHDPVAHHPRIRMPITVPRIVPRPPVSTVPPITTMAMTSSS